MRVRTAFVVPFSPLAVLAALLGTAGNAVAQPGAHTFSGIVRSSSSDEPLPGAVVKKPGTYFLRIARPGFAMQTFDKRVVWHAMNSGSATCVFVNGLPHGLRNAGRLALGTAIYAVVWTKQ